MAISRKMALRIRNCLDNWLPPVIRDSRLLMFPLMRFAYGGKFRLFTDFKRHGFAMSTAEFSAVYQEVAGLPQLQTDTDLNELCIEAILRETRGAKVLDAGCGRGYLAKRLKEVASEVVGCDLALEGGLQDEVGLRFVPASIEALHFADNEFDTVVCAHTLEHVQQIGVALAELRRVARHRVIVVVPKERPYRFSFNLHLHFFPYPWSWHAVAGSVKGATLRDLGDWFYVEDKPDREQGRRAAGLA